MDLRTSLPGTKIAAILVAVALILWRIWERRLVGLSTDWLVLLSLYSIFSVLAPEGRVRSSVTFVTIAGLLLLYAWGQTPFILDLVRTRS